MLTAFNLPALGLMLISGFFAWFFFNAELPSLTASNGAIVTLGSAVMLPSLFYGYLAWNTLAELDKEDEGSRSTLWLELKPGMIGRFQGVLASCVLMGSCSGALLLRCLFA